VSTNAEVLAHERQKKVLDVYTVKNNGFRIPRGYDANHLTMGNWKEFYRTVSPTGLGYKGSKSRKQQHHILV